MKNQSSILKLALFATGLSGIVAEYILSTLATYFLGNSVLQWTMILSIMLFSMGLGSRISRSFEKDLLRKFILIEFTLSILSAFVSVIAYSASAYYGHPGVPIYLMSVVIGLLIGMEIPIVIRLNDQFEELRVNVSAVMENDYYGSLLGGVFFAFVGLPYLGLTYTPFILGSINFLVACSLFFVLKSALGSGEKRQLTGLTLAVFLLISTGFLFADDIVRHGEEKRYKDEIVFVEQTKYQKIVITQNQDGFWLFINGNQQLSSIDEVMYHEPLVHPVMRLSKNPANVLVMGGGDGGAVREILKYEQVKTITLVDLDPVMTKLGQEYELLLDMNQNSLNHQKVTIVNADGYNYLEDNKEYFDIIIIDLPDPKTVELGRLYSYEFYKMCEKRLRPNGLIITQAGSPYYAAEAFHCIEKTLQASGFNTVPMHNQIITLGEWGWVMGSKKGNKIELTTALQNLNYGETQTSWINKEAMTLMTSFGKNVFMKDTIIEVNKIHNPVLYNYYLNGQWDLY
jgi:spermidine synthase